MNYHTKGILRNPLFSSRFCHDLAPWSWAWYRPLYALSGSGRDWYLLCLPWYEKSSTCGSLLRRAEGQTEARSMGHESSHSWAFCKDMHYVIIRLCRIYPHKNKSYGLEYKASNGKGQVSSFCFCSFFGFNSLGPAITLVSGIIAQKSHTLRHTTTPGS